MLLPDNLSVHGPQVDRLFYIILWITGFFFVLVEGLLLALLLRYRRRDGQRAHYTHGDTTLEIVWTTIPAIILVWLTIASQHAWAAIKRDAPADAFEVEVVAEQFAWNIRYPGPDGLFGTADDITTTNQLHVPAGQPVLVHLKSKDVIHSFFVPLLRIKQDAVPGLPGQLWFTAIHPAQIEIACAELCGLGHYRMRGYLTIETPEVFQAWLKQQQQEAQSSQ